MSLAESDLETTTASFNELWDRVNRTRKGSKTVTVEKGDLVSILLDHGRMACSLFPPSPLGKGKWEGPN